MPGYVLVVDDSIDVTKLLMEILPVLGTQGRSLSDGSEALALSRDNPPDTIILDLMMPTMDGFTFLSQLRKEERTRSIPVIVLSALADHNGTLDRLPGIVGAITKGAFSLAELRDLLIKAGALPAPPSSEAKPVAAPPPAPPTEPEHVTPDSSPKSSIPDKSHFIRPANLL